MYRVYTDGACESNGRAGARASYAYVFPDAIQESYAEPLPAEEQQTNNTGELIAIYHALAKAKRLGATSVQVYTDSEYARNCICVWSPGWIRKGWKTTDGKPVKHRELLEKILDTVKTFDSYSIIHVPAHTGGSDEHSKWNDAADRLAVKALELQRSVRIGDLDPPKQTETTVGRPPLPECPLRLMGPPVSEDDLATYAREHLAELLAEDAGIVKTGLALIVKKLLTKKGLDVDKQTIHRRTVYRLTQKTPFSIQQSEDD
jgi:ribonuclease HI